MKRLKVILNEDGYTIYLAVAIALILTILGAGLLILLNNELVILKRNVDYVKAYYLAEAGINHALWNLNHQIAEDVSGSLGDGTYQTSYNGAAKVLRSTGTVNNISRTITVKVTVADLPLAFNYGAFISKTSEIPGDDNNKDANGNVYIFGANEPEGSADKVVVMGYQQLNIHGWIDDGENPGGFGGVGLVYSDTGQYSPASNEGTHFNIGARPDPYPSIPTLDTTSYDNKIASAAADPSVVGNPTYTNLTFNLSESDPNYIPNPLKIKGNVTISGTISGGTPEKPAELIVTKKVTLNNVTVEPYTTIIAGENIYINGNTTIKESGTDADDNADSEFYANSDFYINGYGTIRATLITNYKLWIETGGQLNIYGPVFSTNWTKMKVTNTSARINFYGSIVNGADGQLIFDSIKGKVYIYFDKSFFPTYAPAAFREYNGVSLDYSTWREK